MVGGARGSIEAEQGALFIPVGLVTNLGIERTEAQHDRCLNSDPYNFAPPVTRFFSAFSMFVRGDQVAAVRVVYGGMDGEKSLGRAG